MIVPVAIESLMVFPNADEEVTDAIGYVTVRFEFADLPAAPQFGQVVGAAAALSVLSEV